MDWQLNAIRTAGDTLRETSLAALKKEWGASCEANLNRALETVAFIDRRMGNTSFSEALVRYGIVNDAAFARAMHSLSQLIGEDKIGATSSDAPDPAPESPLEALKAIFKD